MSNKRLVLSRRTALKGMGVSIALPFLEAMTPWRNVLSAQTLDPKRFIVFYLPNACNESEFHGSNKGQVGNHPGDIDRGGRA